MESIRQWAFGICCAAIACGLAQLLMPKSSMQRIFQITTSVFFLSCLLSPIAISLPSLDVIPPEEIMQEIDEKSERLDSIAKEQGHDLATESIRHAAEDTLMDFGIKPNKIYINVHDDGDGGITISECELELDNSYLPQHDEIRAALHKALGVDIRIGYTKGGRT